MAASAVTAQDATVNFNNRAPSDNIYAPVYVGTNTSTLAAGSGYLAQLYYGPAGTSEDRLVSTGPVVDFLTGNAAGYLNVGIDGSRSLPGIDPGAYAVVQIRAWSASAGATYEAALRNTSPGRMLGRSNLSTVQSHSSLLIAPVNMQGLQSFNLVQVPSFIPLNLQRQANHVVISWVAQIAGLVLESSATPDRAGNWQKVTLPQQVIGSAYSVTLPADTNRLFFRLRIPDKP